MCSWRTLMRGQYCTHPFYSSLNSNIDSVLWVWLLWKHVVPSSAHLFISLFIHIYLFIYLFVNLFTLNYIASAFYLS